MKEIYLRTGIFVLFLIWINCKEQEIQKVEEVKPEFIPQGLVLFVIGDVKSGERQLKVGDVVKEKENLRTGKKSVCDVQVSGLETDVTIRMKENSDFSISGHLKKGIKNLQMKIISGKVLVNAQKLNTKDSIETITPTAVVGVRGTKFEVEIGKDSSSSISVLEGRVAAKVIIPEIAALSEEVKEKSTTLKTLDQFLIEKELVIESGNTSVVTKKYAEIGDVLKSADKKNLSEELDKKIVPETFKEKIGKIKDKEIQSPITKILTKTFDEKLKEYEELIAIEKTKLNDPNLKAEELKKRMKAPELMKRIEQIMDQSIEVLILNSGERIQGIILRDTNAKKFIVLTPEGKKEYSEAEVKDVGFPD